MAGQNNILSVVPPPKVVAKKGSVVTAKLNVQLRNGYHVNSNTPAEEYLIPLRLTWTPAPLERPEVVYPKPHSEKYEFSDKPLSVFTGDFDLHTKFQVPASATIGMQMITGKLRFQACSNKECFPPKTIEIKVPVDIVN